MAATIAAAETSRHARVERLAPLILTLGVLLTYGWTAWFGFINDDYGWVERARGAVSGAPAGVGMTMFLRPVVEWSFALNYWLGGANPFGYHVTNVLIELVNTVLVWRLARYVFGDGLASLATGLLFATHPSHAGAVSWVCARTGLIGDGLYLAAVLCHLRRSTIAAAGLFMVSLLSKESGVSFPLLAIVLDRFASADGRWRWRTTAIYAAVLAAYLFLRAQSTTFFAMQYVGLNLIGDRDFAGLMRLVGQQLSSATAALLEPLAIDGVAALVILFALVVVAVWLGSGGTRRAAWLGSSWMLIAVLPFLGWFMFQPRYAYLLSVGLALVLVSVGCGVTSWFVDRRWVAVVVGICAAFWLGAGETAAQLRNEQLRRNGLMSARIIEALVDVAPQPAPHTLFVVDGLGPLRLGRDPWVRTPVFVYGLADAVRLRFADATLDAGFPDTLPPAGIRPVIRLRWDATTGTFMQ